MTTTKDAEDRAKAERSPWPTRPAVGRAAAAQAATVAALQLVAGIRDDRPAAVAAATDHATRLELLALVDVLAAMVPTAPVPRVLLAWSDVVPHLWSDWTLRVEFERFTRGIRDRTALSAYVEWNRRRLLLTDLADEQLASRPTS